MSHKRLIEHELEGFGIRLNKKPPGITFRKKEKGGINFTSTLNETKMDLDGMHMMPPRKRGGGVGGGGRQSLSMSTLA